MNLEQYKLSRAKYLQNAYLPLGLFGFAISTILLSLYNMKVITDTSEQPWAIVFISVCGLVLGGAIQFFSGLRSIYYGHQKTGSILAVFGGFWLIYAIFQLLFYLAPLSGTNTESILTGSANSRVYNSLRLALAVFVYIYATICMVGFYVGLYRNIVTPLVFFVLIFGFIALGTADAIGGSSSTLSNTANDAIYVLQIFGGTMGLIAGLGALYLSWALILSNVFKRNVLPLGNKIIKKKFADVELGE